jgi:hypothetical protein
MDIPRKMVYANVMIHIPIVWDMSDIHSILETGFAFIVMCKERKNHTKLSPLERVILITDVEV